jgi:hypothetical protein
MRQGITIAIICLLSGAASAQAGTTDISYTEDYAPGRLVAMNQGLWDCGDAGDPAVRSAMHDMAHHPDDQARIAAAAGCRRTLDPDRIERPWQVVHPIADLCDERTVEREYTPLSDGRQVLRTFETCGIEAHAVLVERDGVRHAAINVIDFAAYD